MRKIVVSWVILYKFKWTVKRVCLGGAYKTPPTSAIAKASEYIKVIKKHGLETCVTFGSLNQEQAQQLKAAGLDYYNHNIDTSPEHYANVVTTLSALLQL